jgi:hypothetical protein
VLVSIAQLQQTHGARIVVHIAHARPSCTPIVAHHRSFSLDQRMRPAEAGLMILC